ncbi:hypothetical protein Afil01_42820 [Actinorhabdospora filicis]|uniref:Phosphatidic acid phosphatase type 2/haloperoxidase domain-containing protein n=1 Tax=Actinorhabdospora filicis TaxID=1785913 RepID=A0A9W6WC74_9ACTN|nr:phosphatase PAP2 family protein [Actinorhabdospora filicis]GLZ79475.1 hypothetical protein Afil01_42820 [Actinorhabdospora filicis]
MPSENRLARAVTTVLHPAAVVTALCLAVAAHATGTPAGTLAWGLAAALGTSIIPQAVVEIATKRGLLTDRNVTVRAQRLKPLALAITTAALGLAGLWAAGAPRPVLAAAVALLSGVVTTTLVTLLWKISFHTAVATSAVLIIALAFGPVALTGLVLVAAIAWSRVALREHTPAQVLAGVVWGAVVAPLPYWLIAG